MKSLAPLNNEGLKFSRLVGTGGIGSGMFFNLEGNHTLGRNESRAGVMLQIKDYCKLHIISHYISVLLGSNPKGSFRTYPVGNVGNDNIGLAMIEEMKEAGMSVEGIKILSDASTLFSVCFQYPDSTGGNITTSNSASALVTPEQITEFFNKLDVDSNGELVLAAPEVPVNARLKLLEIGRARGSFNIASILVSEVEEFIEGRGIELTDLLALNIDEAGALAGIVNKNLSSKEIAEACIEKLRNRNPQIIVLITDGPNGSFVSERGSIEHVPPLKAKVVSTAGAGDTFLGGTVAALCCGLPLLKGHEDNYFGETPIASAVELGTALASLAVTVGDSIHQKADAQLLADYLTQKSVPISSDFKKILNCK